jgi:FkbH-like protein
MIQPSDLSSLKTKLENTDADFWMQFRRTVQGVESPSDLLTLSRFAARAESKGLFPENKTGLRVLFLGAVTFSPWVDFLSTLLKAEGIFGHVQIGDFDNYHSEILSGTFSDSFDVVFLFPSRSRAVYEGPLLDHDGATEALNERVEGMLSLCEQIHSRTKAEVILANFLPSPHSDLGALGAKVLGSESTFLKHLNLRLGLSAPSYVSILDCEGVAARLGLNQSVDFQAWLESRQPGTPRYLMELARSASRIVQRLKLAPKKVLVLDLDNTLWGGVIGDDGLAGIELGDTSPRSEAFKSFQKAILKLKQRGVLLAVCSKNELAAAELPFREHPEMVLKLDDIVSFKANWNPKPDNICEIAAELNLGLDSLVFVDDNPAEIEIVRKTLPSVETLLLDANPSRFVEQLENCGHFEPRALTDEDRIRTEQYKHEEKREKLRTSVTNLDEYLASLEMQAEVNLFEEANFARISQLINKSNQFNLTTRRRSLAEVEAIPLTVGEWGLSIRLKDKFGDYGIISVLIAKSKGSTFYIDTWLMSCRVLQRGVESVALDQIVEAAKHAGASTVVGEYIRSSKNKLVEEHFDRLGFAMVEETGSGKRYELPVAGYTKKAIPISVKGCPYAK